MGDTTKSIEKIVLQIGDIIISNYNKNNNNDRIIVCLAGPPASGKSTISEQLVNQLNNRLKNETTTAVIVPMDGFHLDNCILKERELLNRKGSPPTFDSYGFLNLLKRLKNQGTPNNNNDNNENNEQPIYIPTFDRNLDLSKAGSSCIGISNKILIVEGNYLLLNQSPWNQFKDYFNLSIFIKVDINELETRLISRWLNHNHNEQQAKERALSNDIPNAKLVLSNSILDNNVLIIENN